ncbi:hypothetical protein CEXT_632881 [Caerostris extrusa]|uniref:Uncharacterized protein n=1 Tax=Caerostris extrusa TaxID=172846 RepID=A0AAV4VVK5_CAEEX|nr:hypothetical protein CEXT_632881 [Caerostris extrusa]
MGHPLNLAFPQAQSNHPCTKVIEEQQQRRICTAGKPRTVYEAFDRHNSQGQPFSLDFSAPLSHIGKNTCRFSQGLKYLLVWPRLSHNPNGYCSHSSGGGASYGGGSSARATETSQRHCMENRLQRRLLHISESVGSRSPQKMTQVLLGKPRTVYEPFDRHNSRSQPCSLDFPRHCLISAKTLVALSQGLKYLLVWPRLSHNPERILLPFIRGKGTSYVGGSSAEQQKLLRGIAWKIDCRGDCYTFPSRFRARVFNFES